MSTGSDIIRGMVDDADDQVARINGNIDQIDEQIDELQIQDDAIISEVTDVTSTELQDYLTNTKLPFFQLTDPGAIVNLGPAYNAIGYTNLLDDWRILDSSANVMYEYNGVGWDSDANIIAWMDEWDFGNDYLTRPLTTGAAYGIRPYIANLNTAKGILQENADKVEDSKTVFDRFGT